MMELLEMILIEIVEKSARADRMFRDLEIVNVTIPVLADTIDCRRGGSVDHRRPLYYRGLRSTALTP
jgi:hypothetical protein